MAERQQRRTVNREPTRTVVQQLIDRTWSDVHDVADKREGLQWIDSDESNEGEVYRVVRVLAEPRRVVEKRTVKRSSVPVAESDSNAGDKPTATGKGGSGAVAATGGE